MISNSFDMTVSSYGRFPFFRSIRMEAVRLKNFVIRDFCIAISYKFQFFFQTIQIVFAVSGIYFVSQMLDGNPESLARYGGNYFCFALMGLAVNSYLRVGLVTITNDIRQSMNIGTLEAVCVTPVSHLMLLLYSSIWQFLFESFRVASYIAIGIIIFGADFKNANLAGALLVLCLTIPIFMMLGIISSSLIILIKRGDPIYWIFSSLGSILAGTLFPVSVMPNWLQTVAKCFPLTHALEAMRLVVLNGYTINQARGSIAALSVFLIISIPLACLVNYQCIKLAKLNGAFSTH